ncbi:MAG: dinuclear metal center YbgI/SA1388 family protein [Limisphaerales bacterium]|jgi:dinuclear metal center YbgI/SA1388 family protein
MIINDIVRILEQWAPPAYQESYDNSGLIVGNRSDKVTGILCCLDSTEAIIDEAVELGYNMVVAHHPIVFSGLKQLTGKNYIERTLLKAIKADIAIYAIHTNLDNVHTGVSNMMAEKLGLVNRQILAPKKGLLSKLVTFAPLAEAEVLRNALFDAGAGVISNYDQCSFNVEGKGTYRGNELSNPTIGVPGQSHTEQETRIEVLVPNHLQGKVLSALNAAHSYEEVAYDFYPILNSHPQVGSGMVGDLPNPMDESTFLAKIKTDLKTDCIRHTALLDKKISRVALCGGAGSFLLNNAKQAGAQSFITADYKYHQFFDADGELLIADVGHFESEQFTIELLHSHLNERLKQPEFAEKFDNFAVRPTRICTNPVNYF